MLEKKGQTKRPEIHIHGIFQDVLENGALSKCKRNGKTDARCSDCGGALGWSSNQSS